MAAAARERVTLPPTDDPGALAATLKEMACANVFTVKVNNAWQQRICSWHN